MTPQTITIIVGAIGCALLIIAIDLLEHIRIGRDLDDEQD